MDGAAEFGKEICARDRRWVFVEEVSDVNGKTSLKGWANSAFIRQVACPG